MKHAKDIVEPIFSAHCQVCAAQLARHAGADTRANATFSPKATPRVSSPALSAGISGNRFSMLFSCARPLRSERVEKSKLLNRNGNGQLKPLNLSGFPLPKDPDPHSLTRLQPNKNAGVRLLKDGEIGNSRGTAWTRAGRC